MDENNELARLAREMDDLARAERAHAEREADRRRREDESWSRYVDDESVALRARIAELGAQADAWLRAWRPTARAAEICRLGGWSERVPLPIVRTDDGAAVFERDRPELRGRRSGRGVVVEVGARITFTRRAWTSGFGGEAKLVLVTECLADLGRAAVVERVRARDQRLEILRVGARVSEVIAAGGLEALLMDALRRELGHRRELLELRRAKRDEG